MMFQFLMVSVLTAGLQPGDGVFVKFYRHPDMTDTFWVSQETTVIFPLVGEKKLSQIDYPALDDSLKLWFSNYIKDPELFVLPLFKVSVIGEVNKPGVYLLSSMDRVFEAIALAGGPTSKADLRRVRIRRGNRVIKVNLLKAIEQGLISSDLGVHSGDVISIPRIVFPTSQEWYFIMAAIAFGWSVYRTLK